VTVYLTRTSVRPDQLVRLAWSDPETGEEVGDVYGVVTFTTARVVSVRWETGLVGLLSWEPSAHLPTAAALELVQDVRRGR